MKKIFYLLLIIPVFCFSQSKKHNLKTLLLSYANIACPCAQWFETKYNKNYSEYTIYIEAANDSLEKIVKFDDFPYMIKVVGEYITKKGYPKLFRMQNKPFDEPGKVFRYYYVTIIPN